LANQSPDRRQILEWLAFAAAAARFPGFVRWESGAQDHTENTVTSPKPQLFRPQFFTPDEFTMLDQLSELILPKDESPGAHDAGVAEFIDFMVANDSELQWPFRFGLDWLNARATASHGKAFIDLAEEQQTALVRPLAYRDGALRDADGRKFFSLVRQYTVMGYYTSRIGLEELNYPGLQFYSESPACPHRGDPEHKHLPPPIV
jgi:Gluconate 2-dehydrogenase subunit 3